MGDVQIWREGPILQLGSREGCSAASVNGSPCCWSWMLVALGGQRRRVLHPGSVGRRWQRGVALP